MITMATKAIKTTNFQKVLELWKTYPVQEATPIETLCDCIKTIREGSVAFPCSMSCFDCQHWLNELYNPNLYKHKSTHKTNQRKNGDSLMNVRDIHKLEDSIAIQVEDLVFDILDAENPSSKAEANAIAYLIAHTFEHTIDDMIFTATENFLAERKD